MPPKPGGGGGGSSPLALSERRLDIGSLPPRDLVALRDQLEAESRSLAQRAMALQQVAAQFGGSGRAIEQLAEQKKGAPIMVPLTSSMHVRGELSRPGRVLLDVGTGYFVDVSAERGADYCRRKIEYVKTKLDEIGAVMGSRRQAVAQINGLLARKGGGAGGGGGGGGGVERGGVKA